MTLKEQLLPEYVTKLVSQRKLYPNSIEKAFEILEQHSFISDLTYFDVLHLMMWCENLTTFGWVEVRSLFDNSIFEKDVMNLFNAE